ARLSTGPKTIEGKANSSRNAITHGIFVKQFLKGATSETVARVEAIAAGLRDHYPPVGFLEEMLLEKVVAESARYGRALEIETPGDDHSQSYILNCLALAARYTTSTSHALFRAIEELERVQAARRARERSAAPKEADSALLLPKAIDEQRTSR